MLTLNLLGELEVLRDGDRVALPPSRKTRALLAYLASTGRQHRRERLCSMFWEVPDDPRGSLRWSMSRLRPLVDEPDSSRIVANRESVAFQANGAEIDLLALRSLVSSGLERLSTEQLEAAAARFRGEFLEGLDLPAQHEFQAWCVAEREDLRRLQVRILEELKERHTGNPESALAAARQLAQVDPFNEAARADLLRLLARTGRQQEAESHFETAERLFREIGPEASQRLAGAWRTIRREAAGERARAPLAIQGPERVETLPRDGTGAAEAPPAPSALADVARFVGREREMDALKAVAEAAASGGSAKVVVLMGEAGIGKSRLVQEFMASMRRRGAGPMIGRAYDARLSTALGPWAEAVGELPLAETDEEAASGREKLFAEVAKRVFAGEGLPILVLDDFQWINETSAELLHHVVRSAQDRALLVVLTARDGELPDNIPANSVLRSLRRYRLVEEMVLDPLPPEDIVLLVQGVSSLADADAIVRLSAGNPLYAEELAQNGADRAGTLPRTLKELVRDRIERLGPEASDLLNWASVLGPVMKGDTLQTVAGYDLQDFLEISDKLERHRLLVPVDQVSGQDAYTFAHELLREAIYTGLSEPRRRVMHLKIARVLQQASGGAAALDVARHAAAGGDGRMAARACVLAGRHCMRLFAHGEAMALVRHGQHYAEALPDPDRLDCLVDLAEIELRTSRPDDPARFMERLEALAEAALNHGCGDAAGRCYRMLATLRWEGGAWSDAQRDTLRGELVSRGADERQRAVALGEAARCLVMLERDLPLAEALVLEADALARRAGVEPNAIADATALLRCHQGEFEKGRDLLRKARMLAWREGDRACEFLALEHLLTLEIELGELEAAASLCEEAVELAARLPSGSDLPFAKSLAALCRYVHGRETTLAAFDAAMDDLRAADAKHRLAFAAMTAARILFGQSENLGAERLALEALAAATLLERHSDMVSALAILARIAGAKGDGDARTGYLDRLGEVMALGVSEAALRAAEDALVLPHQAMAEA